ncbi:MAG: hypothetical protein ABI707_09480 [Ferruginibacter sp.]
MNIKDRFIQEYAPLVKQFIEEIKGVNSEGLPAPHLPVYGAGYDDPENYKIAFVGWETRENVNLKEFISLYQESSIKAVRESSIKAVLEWWDEDFSEEEGFIFANGYHNHSGNDFWGFIFKFLSVFYNKNDWREVKDGKFPAILKSFVWANLESIERFEITDRGLSANIEDYNKVKKASLVFEKASYLVNVFSPKIIIVLRWQEDDSWLTESYGCRAIRIADHLDYYFIESTKTHIFWSAHPGWLARNKRIPETISTIIEAIHQKQIFNSFPGEDWLKLEKERPGQMENLKEQLKAQAFANNLTVVDEDWGTGGESYFYFKISPSKRNTSICFGFDSGFKDFSIGVEITYQSEGYTTLKNEISKKLIPIIGSDNQYTNWAYLHYFDDDLKNWETNPEVWEGIESGKTADTLMGKVKEIQEALKDLDL